MMCCCMYDHSNENVQNLVMQKNMCQGEKWSHINIWRSVCGTLIHLEKIQHKFMLNKTTFDFY
jgi:hypothetical protein